MQKPQFHTRMKRRRKELSLSQRKAAENCGLKPRRWSALERNVRQPTNRELEIISRYLKLGSYERPIPKLHQLLVSQASRLLPTAQTFLARQDRSSHQRFRKCRRSYPDLTRRLCSKIDSRADARYCWSFAHNVSFDSALEVLHFLYLLADGGMPGLFPPSQLGHTPLPIVDPEDSSHAGHRPHCCILRDGAVWFFQVSFRGVEFYRVDMLVSDSGNWKAVEINGAGHDYQSDHLRSNAIGLPIEWLDERQVITKVTEFLRNSSQKNVARAGLKAS